MSSAKELTRRFEIVELLRSVKHVALKFRGVFLNYADRRLANAYFRQDGTKKLQIGSGANLLPGWLNTNFGFDLDLGVFFLDATRPFPFPDDTFKYVYSEHMIEHVPYQAGRAMLKECLRVLKPGGVVRIATPDLQFLIKLYCDPQRDLHGRYIRWSCDDITDCPGPYAGFVLNNFVRDWGHQFIYDETTLRLSLEASGFSNIKRTVLGVSDHQELSGIDFRSRMPEGFLELESLVMEAEKPNVVGPRHPVRAN